MQEVAGAAERELKELRRTCWELEREISLLQRSSTTRSIPRRQACSSLRIPRHECNLAEQVLIRCLSLVSRILPQAAAPPDMFAHYGHVSSSLRALDCPRH